MLAVSSLKGLSRVLVEKKLLSLEQIEIALLEANQEKTSLFLYLARKKLIPISILLSAAAYGLGVSIIDLEIINLNILPLSLIPMQLIKRYRVLPIDLKENCLYLAMLDPFDYALINELKFHTGFDIFPLLAEENILHLLLERFSQQDSSVGANNLDFESLENLEITETEHQEFLVSVDELQEDPPIVQFVNKIFLIAIHKKASDLHFEPYAKQYRIRMRVDGVLYDIAHLSAHLATRFAARLKVMANLDIAERRVPQDGAIKLNLSDDYTVDLRVSTCPTLYGEKIVLRILDQQQVIPHLENLGLEEAHKKIFLQSIHNPYGLILVTGPTGSGKSYTLYAALHLLNATERNILTVEDPVEMPLYGVNQVNINLKTGLNYPTVLKAFLRQDPDVIMLGEMRDTETAAIGIKAAQTGHLVLSTLHTNSAVESLSRLSNMGIPYYDIASAISLIIAQRLVRTLCIHCKRPSTLALEILLAEGLKEEEVSGVYEAVGCNQCMQGYKGRTGVFEVLPVTVAIQEAILSGCNILELKKIALKEGMLSLEQAGLLKVKQGITSITELHRVIKV